MPEPGPIRVKICGVTKPAHVRAAADAGAAYVGFVAFPRSPRHLSPDAAAGLARLVPTGVTKVALMVDPDDASLDAYLDQVPVDMLQLHGSETPDRVRTIRARTGLPVMKAVGLSSDDDLLQIARYAEVADQLLVDAKPPEHGAESLPGGNGLSFDWRLIAGHRWSVPWMLAGGLTVDTVAEAIHRSGARQVDVSSGVEASRGVKDVDLIKAFIASAQSAFAPSPA